ncbi:MAG TPA: hypothetical protein VIF83_05825 [Gemmatimonadaceae bacterium]
MLPQSFRYTLAATLGAAILTSCAQVAPAFGPTPPEARANADDFFGSIAERLTNVQRSPKYFRARARLGKAALIPSTVYNDTSVWTSIGVGDNTRTLFVQAEFVDNHYAFFHRPNLAPVDRRSDGRHLIRLRKLSHSEYEWMTQVDFAIGRMRGDDFAFVVNRLLASAEQRSPAMIRNDYRTNFPRATAVWGRLFSLDTIRTVTDPDGATSTTLSIRLTQRNLRPQYNAFVDFLDKYALGSRYRMVITDKRGVRWLEFSGKDSLAKLRVRSRGGLFAPLTGPVRTMPDSLIITSDFTTKVLVFNVGFRRLVGDLIVQKDDRERALYMHFQKEPDWSLPPAVGMLIRTPLRRPFTGTGSSFRIALHENPGGQTLITRRTIGVVEESAILRFLNRLSGTMMGDFVEKTEAEENRFGAEAFNALRADIRALLP